MATIETSFYDVLGIARDADGATIKTAYRRAAMDCHPDRNGGCTDAAERFKALNEAHDVLKDPQKRAAYDRFGKAAFQNGGGPGAQADMGGFSDIFENIFGDFMGGRQQQRGGRTIHRGQDLRYDLEMTLQEAFAGKEAKIEARAPRPALPAAGAARCARNRASSWWSARAPPATALGRRSPIRARCAGASGAWSETSRSTSPFRAAWTTARASVWRARAKRACAADRRAIFICSST